MELLNELALRCRVEGYRLGLSGERIWWEGRIDQLCPEMKFDGFGESPDFQTLVRAMSAGVQDGYLAYARNSGLFLSPEQAAEAKGVATNTLHRLLRNPKRAERFFERSTWDGEGKRRVWLLHPDDVKEWTPDERGRKRAGI